MRYFVFFALLIVNTGVFAQKYSFDFSPKGNVKTTTVYGRNSSFGYDLGTAQDGENPFFFSVDVPEGNYKVKVVLGNDKYETVNTVKAENRRLMIENLSVPKDKKTTQTFTVNIRNLRISETDSVRINPREIGKLLWDNKLTLEFNGKHPSVRKIEIEKADNLPTIFLAGNSTVVDEASEPWSGWGQLFTRFLKPDVVVANYAESGQAANTFVSSKRLEKLLTKMKKGDYLFIEFGHNDMKQTGPGKGPYLSYKSDLKLLVDKAKEKGATPILVTPMHRRSFDSTGKVINTHGEHPNAMRQLAKEENVYLIDLNNMSQTLYEAWGVEGSKKAFVHFPAGTFPGQDKPLADNTHFNQYGGYQIARCILQGITDAQIPLKKYVLKEYQHFDPAKPQNFAAFSIPPTPFTSLEKPLGN